MRLIDADRLLESMQGTNMLFSIKDLIDLQPTVFDKDEIEQQTYERGYKYGYDKGWSDGRFCGIYESIKSGWTPTENDLPKKDGLYVVTIGEYEKLYKKDKNMVYEEHTKIGISDYHNGKFHDYLGRPIIKRKVLAWLPLPEYHIADATEKVGDAE